MEAILDEPIPENNLTYPKDKIKTLEHLRWYLEQACILTEKTYIDAIQILTGIDISNVITGNPDNTIIAKIKKRYNR